MLTPVYLLRCPPASLRGARSLAYQQGMSRSLRSVRLASGHARDDIRR